MLNDSTAYDAAETGLTELCEIVDNGCDCIGTILEMTSPGFNRMFDDADFVISKGQGNFETLGRLDNSNKRDKEIVFFLQAKCDVVSKEIGLSRGSMVLLSSANLP